MIQTIILILMLMITFVIFLLWVETYKEKKFLEEQEKQQRLNTLHKYKMMTNMNESDYILGNISKGKYEENLAEISRLIDEYEKAKR